MKRAFAIGMMVAALVATNAHAWGFYDTYNAMEPQESVPPIRFRGLEWFCSPDDVADLLLSEGVTADDLIEPEDSDADITFVVYEVAGMQMVGGYLFDDDLTFIMGMYQSMESHVIFQEYYDEFLKLQDALIYLYGDVTLNDDQFYLDYYKDKEDSYGIGVAFGQMSLSRGWMDADGAAIVLTMTGADKSVDIVIYYIAPEMSFSTQSDIPNTDGL